MNTNDMNTNDMNTNDMNTSRRHRIVAVGAAAMVAVVASSAFVRPTGDSASAPRTPSTNPGDHAELRDLVNRGIVPWQALEPVPMSGEEELRDLVNRGIIPRGALAD